MSKQIPKVAVVTRTKDRPVLLKRALESIHNQTMDDFVHVIVNDGGDKATIEKLVEDSVDLTKGRVKLLHNDKSIGMEAASNIAIKASNSTYIAIHDDDDSWHKDFLKHTVTHLDSTGNKGVVVKTERVDEHIESNNIIEDGRKPYMPDLRFISLYRQCLDNQMTPITFLYRRSVLDEIGYYDEQLSVCGDWDFGIRFIRKYDVDFLSEQGTLAYYHHRPASEGLDANSVFKKSDTFEQTLNYLRNKYLREDLQTGKLGVGYIMTSMEYQRTLNGQGLRAIELVSKRVEHTDASIRKLLAVPIRLNSFRRKVLGKHKES